MESHWRWAAHSLVIWTQLPIVRRQNLRRDAIHCGYINRGAFASRDAVGYGFDLDTVQLTRVRDETPRTAKFLVAMRAREVLCALVNQQNLFIVKLPVAVIAERLWTRHPRLVLALATHRSTLDARRLRLAFSARRSRKEKFPSPVPARLNDVGRHERRVLAGDRALSLSLSTSWDVWPD